MHVALAFVLLVATSASPKVSARRTKKAAPAAKGNPKKATPPIEILNVNTREVRSIALYDRKGKLRPEARKVIKHIFRCRRSGRARTVDQRLVSILYKTFRHFGQRQVQLVSGYRWHKVDGGRPGTAHHTGRAADFRIPGVSNRRLLDYLRSHHSKVGVGYYPNSSFVHLDVRDRSALWVDISGPGGEKTYLRDPRAALAREDRGEPIYRVPPDQTASSDAADQDSDDLPAEPAPPERPPLPSAKATAP